MATKEEQDKAFEQILAIAREAGLLIFKTDEADEERYTDRILIERPVDDTETEQILERAIFTDEGTALVKELRKEGMDDKEIATLIKGVDFEDEMSEGEVMK